MASKKNIISSILGTPKTRPHISISYPKEFRQVSFGGFNVVVSWRSQPPCCWINVGFSHYWCWCGPWFLSTSSLAQTRFRSPAWILHPRWHFSPRHAQRPRESPWNIHIQVWHINLVCFAGCLIFMFFYRQACTWWTSRVDGSTRCQWRGARGQRHRGGWQEFRSSNGYDGGQQCQFNHNRQTSQSARSLDLDTCIASQRHVDLLLNHYVHGPFGSRGPWWWRARGCRWHQGFDGLIPRQISQQHERRWYSSFVASDQLPQRGSNAAKVQRNFHLQPQE